MKFLLFLSRVFNKIIKSDSKLSFSQCGEDLIILFIINALQLKNIQYFDIGTNDPISLNNTYLLYLKGYRGVCIEPDPNLNKKILKHRPHDKLLTCGISQTEEKSASFYLMDSPLLNTFSKSEMENMVNHHGRKLKDTISVPLISINQVFEKHLIQDSTAILSIDIEGLDFFILKTLDFATYRPAIICVETISYSANLTGKKDKEIAELLAINNYVLYADTYINSIYLDQRLLNNN